MREREWISARRSELDALAAELAKQLQEVQVERDELAIAERVLERLAEQLQLAHLSICHSPIARHDRRRRG